MVCFCFILAVFTVGAETGNNREKVGKEDHEMIRGYVYINDTIVG